MLNNVTVTVGAVAIIIICVLLSMVINFHVTTSTGITSSTVRYDANEQREHHTTTVIPDGQQPIKFYGQNMHSEDIEVSVSLAVSIVTVTILVHRSCCLCFDNVLVSQSLQYTRMIHERFGPDEFLVFFEGRQLQAMLGKHLTCGNLYTTSIPVVLEGKYRLKIVHLRREYDAVNEIILEFPQPHYDIVVDESIWITGLKVDETTESMDTWATIETNNLLDMRTQYFMNPQYQRGNLTISSYVNFTKLPSGCEDHFDFYEWQTFDVVDGKWTIRNNLFTPEVLTNLLNGKRIVFVGDSHTRLIAGTFAEYCCGVNEHHNFAFSQRESFELKYPISSTTCSDLSIRYIANDFCDFPILSLEVDVLFLNCGHHPASMYHFKYQTFETLIREVVANIEDRDLEENVIWMESVVQPLRNDHWPIDVKDWRTPSRLYAFNMISSSIMTAANIPVLPTFSWTLPLV